MVVAVSKSRAEPILLGSETRALVDGDGCDTDDVPNEGLAAVGVGLLLR